MSEYNGHESWDHWNVALWLYNDEGLYHLVRQAARRTYDAQEGAEELLSYLHANDVDRTPDGAVYTEETLAAAIADEYDEP